jgi:hypothetical protein
MPNAVLMKRASRRWRRLSASWPYSSLMKLMRVMANCARCSSGTRASAGRTRGPEKAAMQHCALLVRRAPQHPGFGQHQQAVDEHLAAAVQALGEGIQAPSRSISACHGPTSSALSRAR